MLAACLSVGFADLAQARPTKVRHAQARAAGPGTLRFPDAALEPSSWGRLDAWPSDDHASAYATFVRSCRALLSEGNEARSGRRFAEAMKTVCRRAMATPQLDEEKARAFFESNFQPLRIAKAGDPEGFLTGYYEPIVAGSRFPTPEYNVPLYRRPGDLIAAGARKKKGVFSNKGSVYRKVGRKRVPYYTRAEIEDGALDGRHLEICWLKDPIDAFFIHIQGSARIQLEDGSMLRVNYDAHNGHRYLPVGRVLIDRGEVSKEEMSMERIRQWMLAQPDGGRALRRMNNSFVFFRVVGLGANDEPTGAQGVSLTPGRSIAVDRNLHLYGTLFWIEAELPIASEVPETKFRRLMVAQDTGSAIVGPARADIYFGAGEEAGLVGGRIKQPGRFAMLVPSEIDPFLKWRNVPLPPARPEEAVASVAEPTPVASAAPVPLPMAAPSKTERIPHHAGLTMQTASGKPEHKKPHAKPATPKPQAEPQSTSPFSGLARLFGSKSQPKPAASAAPRTHVRKREASAPRP
jgi:membrane-bound lytic murein transglycosylase A